MRMGILSTPRTRWEECAAALRRLSRATRADVWRLIPARRSRRQLSRPTRATTESRTRSKFARRILLCRHSSERNPPNGHPGLSVIVTVLLLDGDTWANSSRWTFSYDSYGNITRLGLPTGGSITYGWSLFNPNSNCIGISKMTRVVSTRTIDDNNGHTFRWTYGYVAPTSLGAPFANTVTDPLNNDTLHYFFAQDNACTYYEQTTQYFQGVANSGTPKKQVDMTYARPSSVVNEAT